MNVWTKEEIVKNAEHIPIDKWVSALRVEEFLDWVNSNYGDEYDLCLFCGARTYNGKEGIIHEEGCLLRTLREKIHDG